MKYLCSAEGKLCVQEGDDIFEVAKNAVIAMGITTPASDSHSIPVWMIAQGVGTTVCVPAPLAPLTEKEFHDLRREELQKVPDALRESVMDIEAHMPGDNYAERLANVRKVVEAIKELL